MPVIIRDEMQQVEEEMDDDEQVIQMMKPKKIKIANKSEHNYTYFLNMNSKKVDICLEPADIRFHMTDKRYRVISKEQYEIYTRQQQMYRNNFKTLLGSHSGQEIHIIGNGPSLKDMMGRFRFTDVVTIGVNAAPLAIPDLNYWVVLDELKNQARPLWDVLYKWWKFNNKSITIFNNSTVDLIDETKAPDFLFERQNDINPSGLYWYGSSVHAAIDLALKMGACKIFLWGIDYGNRSHFYTGSRLINSDNMDQPDGNWSDFGKHCQGFMLLKEYADKKKVPIINCNPESKLTIFPRIDPMFEFSNMDQQCIPWTVDDTVVSYEYTNPDGVILQETVNNIPKIEPEPAVHEDIEVSAKFDFATDTIILKNANGMRVLRIADVKKDKSISVILNGYKKLKALVEKVGYDQI